MEISREETAKEERDRKNIIIGMLVRGGPVLAKRPQVAKIKACFGVAQQTKQIHLQSAFWLKIISVCKMSCVLLACPITNTVI